MECMGRKNITGVTSRKFYLWLAERGITHPNKFLAEELGLSPSTITKYCNHIDSGRRDRTAKRAIAKFLSVADKLNGRPSAKVRRIFS
jgi:DNA-binding CsgD family transcriptional regulator